MKLILMFDTNEVYDENYVSTTPLLNKIDKEIEDLDGPKVEQSDDIYKLETLHEMKCAIEGRKLVSCLWEILYNLTRTKHMEDVQMSKVDVVDEIRAEIHQLLEDRGVINLVEDC